MIGKRSKNARPDAGEPSERAGEVSNEGLVVNDATIRRVGFDIVRSASLVAPVGKVTVVLGANGVGKTTLLDGISGVIPVASGSVHLGGVELTSVPRRKRALLGLGYVEQGRRILAELTAEENLMFAADSDWSIDEAFALFPELEQRRGIRAGMLSGGEQQMLVIARALSVRPKVLMVDEMSLGLAPRITSRLIAMMRTLADERNVGILLVEQLATLALKAGDHAYVIGGHGHIVYDGRCQVLIDNPDILRRAYLGEQVSAVAVEAGNPG